MILSRLSSLWFCFLPAYVRFLHGLGLIYGWAFICLFFGFVVARFPLFWFVWGFCFFLLILIGSLFVSVVLLKLLSDWRGSFLQFLPVNTPIWISPIICILEVVSFCIRPLVLVLRPLVNISLGLVVMQLIVYFSFDFMLPMLVFWFVWFFYEVFVCFVQWFIVFLIISFTFEI